MRYPLLMGIPTTHRDVIAWREAMALVEEVYRDTARFPAEEMFALTAQIRRSALAVPAHLAEGATRDTIRELIQFLGMSCGSIAALETQLEIAARLGYLESGAGSMIRTRRLATLVSVLRQSLRKEAIQQPRVGAAASSTSRWHREDARPPYPRLRSPVT